ncbi:NlpC/P60 family protein [Leucobacter sp. USHLN153]|uniref:NlpC/P60 family protein n=1 Tax=Leucobacter sp. USHLN153 TaxID=3081268 RepID=UPI00301B3853
MTQHSSADVVLPNDLGQRTPTRAKRFVQMAGAAALSLGMVGTFSIPAYAASPNAEGAPDANPALQQSLTAAEAEATVLDSSVDSVEGAEFIAADQAAVEEKKREAEAKKAAEAAEKAAAEAATTATPVSSSRSGSDVPAGEGASGLVNAAIAQVGVNQDCTDLVQNSLAAIGLTTRRDQGGYDHGVQDFARYGTPVTDGNYAPGDILMWPGAPHVAIYIGNGQAVHGGWGGNQTVVSTYASPNASPTVVRLS